MYAGARRRSVLAPGGRSGRRQGGNAGDERPGEASWDLFDNPRYCRSLAIGMTVAQCFDSSETLGIVDMADRLGLTRSTTHRYAATLQALGWLEQTQERKYRLSGKASGPGIAVLDEIVLGTDAHRLLNGLRRTVGYTASLGVLDGTRAAYVCRLFAHRRSQYDADCNLRGGAHIPLHCTALGKALLAGLPEAEFQDLLGDLPLERHTRFTIMRRGSLREEIEEVRAGGVAVSDREFYLGARSLAVVVSEPFWDRLLAFEVNVPSAALTAAQLRRQVGPVVRDAARIMSKALQTPSRRVLRHLAAKCGEVSE